VTKTDLELRAGRILPYTHDILDANFNRLLYYSGAWSAGTYEENEVVNHSGGLWVCVATTTTAEPGTDILSWQPLAPVSGRGAMNLLTPFAGTVGSGWTVVPFDNITVNPYGLSFDLANNQFTIQFLGVWQFLFVINLSFSESQQGRNTSLRLWNVTDGVQVGPTLILPIGRNQDGVLTSIPYISDLLAGSIGKTLQFEIGGIDDLGATTFEASTLGMNQIGVPVT